MGGSYSVENEKIHKEREWEKADPVGYQNYKKSDEERKQNTEAIATATYPEESGKTFQIFIREISGRIICLEVGENYTVALVRKLLYDRGHVYYGKLIYSGKLIWNNKTLKDYGISSEETLYHQFMLRGD